MSNLTSAAREVLYEMDLGHGSNAGTVAAALRTESGNVYTGICLHISCGIGFCAEHSAVAEMLKHQERVVVEIVAVNHAGILPPCGRCRELLWQVSPANRKTMVHVAYGKLIPLNELLPNHWLDVSDA